MSTRGIHKYYSLLQAFDLTGQRLFQSDWTGQEYFAAPADDPLPSRKRQQEIELELVTLRQQDRALQREILEELTEAERCENTEESKKVWASRDLLRTELNELPYFGDVGERDFSTFTRRMDTEKILREAFGDKKLSIRLMTGLVVPYHDWITKRRFYISFAQSLVLPPVSAGLKHRRCAAYILRDQFDSWLFQFAKDAVSAGEYSVEEKCRIWLLDQAQNPKGKRVKADFFAEVKATFPDLSERAFNRVWAAEAPPTWKRPIRAT